MDFGLSIQDLPARRNRLDTVLAERDLAAVWFGRSASFAWLTGGRNTIDRSSPVGIAAAGYDGDGVTVVTDGIEADRLATEELPDEVAVESHDWYRTDLATAVAEYSPTPAAADFDVPNFERIDPSTVRQPLTDGDLAAYRELGRETADVVESVMRSVTATDTEREVAARLRGRLFERGIESPVVLVGGGERAQTYRHYTPTDEQLGAYALASVVGQRGGLFASCTRTVAFDPPDWLRSRTRAAARVEVSALAATARVGTRDGTAAEVFEAIQDAYAAVDHPDEWTRHHQGGAAGYASREWIATPSAHDPVSLPMAYAWNPTITGAKSEDTYLVTASDAPVTSDDVELVTETGNWPMVDTEAVDADLRLDRHAVLDR